VPEVYNEGFATAIDHPVSYNIIYFKKQTYNIFSTKIPIHSIQEYFLVQKVLGRFNCETDDNYFTNIIVYKLAYLNSLNKKKIKKDCCEGLGFWHCKEL